MCQRRRYRSRINTFSCLLTSKDSLEYIQDLTVPILYFQELKFLSYVHLNSFVSETLTTSENAKYNFGGGAGQGWITILRLLKK
jgi:xanthine dehydrogenase molybdopterin-binding subunit B